MVQVSYPGVYVVEVPSGVHTITGVATSIAAFFGRTTKGPMNKAVRCLSIADVNRTFGAPVPESDLAHSVRLFFANGGTDCYIIRLASGAQLARITLRSLAGQNMLTVTAKSAGIWGNGVRLEVNYNTPNPDESCNLVVIEEDGSTEISRETHANVSMDPASPRFAPDLITQSSALIDVALHADAQSGGAADIAVLANSFAGFSQTRVFQTTPIGAFRTEFEAILNATPQFQISVDGSPYIPVTLANVLAGLPGAWTLVAMAGAIQAEINNQLMLAIPGLSVACSWQTIGNVSALRIASATAVARSVNIRRSASNDFAVPAMLGLDQGGIEPARYSNFRPVPTAAFFAPVDQILALGGRARDDITSIAVNGLPPVGFSFAALTPAATDPWFLDSTGHADGIREKLRAIAAAVNGTAGFPWRAEVWSYHLAFIAREGPIGRTAASVISATDTILGGANFVRNVRRYTLGSTGTSTFQQPPVAGDAGTDGTAPGLAEFVGNPALQTGFNALDTVDLFNLMIIPADQGIPSATHLSLWGPASNYCTDHRAFLLIDPPPNWVSNGRPAVVTNTTLLNDLRALVVKNNSAVFFPRIRINDRGLLKYVGPSGAIAGLMSRIDSTRGVWKAPAGIEADLRNIVDLEVNLTDLENGVLNKLAGNCLRKFPGGFVCWGARTLDGFDDNSSEWKYIPIRRLALFLEESLYRGTKWVVFEPNDEPLWAKIRLNLNAFMMGLFRQGAFQGSTPDKAFYVKCDGETTTQNDRNLGIVNIEVGFAPLKPAEFVVIKIQQIAGDLT
jgi:uncharacterized protein